MGPVVPSGVGRNVRRGEVYVASGCRAGMRRNVGAGLPFSRLFTAGGLGTRPRGFRRHEVSVAGDWTCEVQYHQSKVSPR